MNIVYEIVAQDNSQCKDDNLKRWTEIIMPLLEEYIDTIDFDKYDQDEFSKFVEDFKEGIPFDFQVQTGTYGMKTIPDNEVWIIVHNRANHNCRININLLPIFRERKINDILNE